MVKVELINFSGPKLSIGWRDSADCGWPDCWLQASMLDLAGSVLFMLQGAHIFNLSADSTGPQLSPRGFMGKFSPLTIIKFLPLKAPTKTDPNYSPLKKLKIETTGKKSFSYNTLNILYLWYFLVITCSVGRGDSSHSPFRGEKTWK